MVGVRRLQQFSGYEFFLLQINGGNEKNCIIFIAIVRQAHPQIKRVLVVCKATKDIYLELKSKLVRAFLG
ncbi:hypothetical protein SDJN03_19621, partial [Cucurbita argyrosperma subsp. sororia]